MKTIQALNKRISDYFQTWSRREKILLFLVIYFGMVALGISPGQIIGSIYQAGRAFGQFLATIF